MDTESIENSTDTMDTDTRDSSNGMNEDNSDEPITTGVQQRKDFTSEVNKIEINNMGRFQYGVCTILFNFFLIYPTFKHR